MMFKANNFSLEESSNYESLNYLFFAILALLFFIPDAFCATDIMGEINAKNTTAIAGAKTAIGIWVKPTIAIVPLGFAVGLVMLVKDQWGEKLKQEKDKAWMAYVVYAVAIVVGIFIGYFIVDTIISFATGKSDETTRIMREFWSSILA